ncbi:hypothetical protein EJB05_34389, partial [Eragrostis curvula]
MLQNLAEVLLPTAAAEMGGGGGMEVDLTHGAPAMSRMAEGLRPVLQGQHAVSDVQYGGCYGSVPPQNTVDAKMQQLSLDDHQNQKLLVTTTGENFDTGCSYPCCCIEPI